MKDDETTTTGQSELAEAEVRQARRVSLVWIIPIVAVIAAGGLAYRTYQQEGPTITITLPTAEGLEAGKSVIRYKDVVIGTVKDITLSAETTHTVVTGDMKKSASPLLVEGTRFWVVRPQISAAGISGLGTLLSGHYITLAPGPAGGEAVTAFQGLEEAPMDPEGHKALEIVVKAATLGGISDGAPVYFREVPVGRIRHHKLAENGETVTIHLAVHAKYAHLVRENTRFWSIGGIRFTAGWEGVDVNMESIRSLLVGGFAFDTPGKPGNAAVDGASFNLYADRAAALGNTPPMAPADVGLELVLRSDTLGGVSEGAPVYHRGFVVGRVERHALDAAGNGVTIHLAIDKQYAGLVHDNTRFWDVGGLDITASFRRLSVQVGTLKALLAGGVAFDTPGKPGHPAGNASTYRLYPTRVAALGERPPIPPAEVGLELVLRADRLGGLDEGAPVYHLDVPVGRVERHALDKHGRHLEVHIAIEKRYAHLVRENTRFWNASGIDVTAGLKGVQVQMETIQSLLAGGIAFDTPHPLWKEVSNGHRYKLYAHRNAAFARHHHGKPLQIVVEADRLGSLRDGDPVYYREEQVGQVERHALHPNSQSVGLLLSIDYRYNELVRANTIFWNASGISAHLGLSGLQIQTESLAALLKGGVAFATPNQPGGLVAEGSVFKLYDKLDDDWLAWSPDIWIGPGKNPDPKAAQASESERKRIHHKLKSGQKESDLPLVDWFENLF